MKNLSKPWVFLAMLIVTNTQANSNSIEQVMLNHQQQLTHLDRVPIDYARCESLPELNLASVEKFIIAPKLLPSVLLEKSLNNTLSSPPQMLQFILLVVLILYLLHGRFNRKSLRIVSYFLICVTTTLLIVLQTAWFMLFYVKHELINQGRYQSAIEALSPALPIYEHLIPHVWQINPAKQLSAYAVNKAISEALNNHEPLTAAQIAKLDSQSATANYREQAFLSAAEQLLYQGTQKFDKELSQSFKLFRQSYDWAKKANDISDSFHSQLALEIILAKQAMYLAHSGNYSEAINLLESIKHGYASIYVYAFAFVVREQTANLLVDTQFDLDSIQLSVNIVEKYLDKVNQSKSASSQWSLTNAQPNPGQLDLLCHLVGLKEISAQMLMTETTLIESIEVLLEVSRLVKNSTTVESLLPEAYRIYGLSQLAEGKYSLAVKGLEMATTLQPDNQELRCELAQSLLERGYNFAANNQFSTALNDARRAESSCQSADNHLWQALINLTYGEYLMRHGSWVKAENALRNSVSYQAKEISPLAQRYLTDINNAKLRENKIRRVASWAKIPEITGSLCVEEDDGNAKQKTCRIILFNGNQAVAEANQDFTEVFFVYPNGTMLLDTDRNGYFDTVRYDDGLNSHVLVDSNNDLRLDSELWYRNNNLVASEQHSGKILLRVPHGAIGKATDLFSAPDAYLKLYHNRYYLGRTSTSNNSSYPSWRYEGFSLSYKHKDKMLIQMMDEDLFVDDKVDEFLIERLPGSGYLIGSKNKAAIDLSITPTSLPNGFYEMLGSEAVSSSFRHAIELEDKQLANIVQAAALEESRAKLASNIAALVAPEAVIATLLKGASLPRHIAFAIIGHELMYGELKNSSEE